MDDLKKRLIIKAGCIEMCEAIAWGSDSAIMREAAARITKLEDARIAELEAHITLRDHFAGQALEGLIATWDGFKSEQDLAEGAFKMADAMLTERRGKANE